ncbi:hypothetical protein B0H11DRAFT_2268905 [Mycena galericulata]|nr:hypothetical protein B0H11DRAFT_2268905 [Mycena galericulata]
MYNTAAAAFLVGLLAPFALGAPHPGKVPTPGGYRTNANVLAIPEGGSLRHIDNEIHVLAADGTVVHVAASGAPTRVKSTVAPEQTGWITFASWSNEETSPIESFTTTWTVPPAPETSNGQTVFLFNSIEPTAGDAILQPVLQYGPSAAGGGEYWAVASWYLDSSSTFFTSLVSVNPGDVLTGLMTLTGTDGSTFNYTSAFTGIPNTALAVGGAASELTWATETLEAYAVTGPSDYPAGATEFSGINLALASGVIPSVQWSTSDDAADGLSTTINTDGATDALITITY